MSATVSMHLRSVLLKRFFQADAAPALPASLYVALTYDVAPSNALGVMMTEPLLGAYARQAYPLGSARWAESGFGEVIQTQPITFPMATLDWGLLQGWALLDSATIGAGTSYASGSLVTPTYVEAGRTIVIAPHNISLGIYD